MLANGPVKPSKPTFKNGCNNSLATQQEAKVANNEIVNNEKDNSLASNFLQRGGRSLYNGMMIYEELDKKINFDFALVLREKINIATVYKNTRLYSRDIF